MSSRVTFKKDRESNRFVILYQRTEQGHTDASQFLSDKANQENEVCYHNPQTYKMLSSL